METRSCSLAEEKSLRRPRCGRGRTPSQRRSMASSSHLRSALGPQKRPRRRTDAVSRSSIRHWPASVDGRRRNSKALIKSSHHGACLFIWHRRHYGAILKRAAASIAPEVRFPTAPRALQSPLDPWTRQPPLQVNRVHRVDAPCGRRAQRGIDVVPTWCWTIEKSPLAAIPLVDR